MDIILPGPRTAREVSDPAAAEPLAGPEPPLAMLLAAPAIYRRIQDLICRRDRCGEPSRAEPTPFRFRTR
jgi:hypothetical protein